MSHSASNPAESEAEREAREAGTMQREGMPDVSSVFDVKDATA